jgi:hypothetical protein
MYHLVLFYFHSRIFVPMRITFFLLFTGLFLQQVRAQKFLITERVELNLRRDEFTAIGQYQDYLATYFNHNGAASICLYDSLGKLVNTIPISDYHEGCTNLRFQCSKENICVYFEQRNGKTQQLMGTRLISNSHFSDAVELAAYERNVFKERNEYQYAVSQDGSKVLFYTYTPGSEEIAVQAIVLNDSLVQISSISELFEKDKIRFLFDEVISNEGYAHILASTDLTPRGHIDQVKLLSIRPKGNGFRSHDIELKGKYIDGYRLFYNDALSIVQFVSYYADSEHGSLKGLCFSTLNPRSMEESITRWTNVQGIFQDKKNDLRDFYLQSFSLLKDGSVEFATEKKYQNSRSSTNISSQQTGMGTFGTLSPLMDMNRMVTDYYFEEVMVFNINKENRLNWTQSIIKSQLTTDDDGMYSSYSRLENTLGAVYIFNDLDRRNNKLMTGYLSSKGVLNMKQMPINETMEKWSWLPKSSIQTSLNTLWIPGITKGYLCYLRIQY